MRVGELVGIAMSDWDRDGHTILLRDTKNGRNHQVLLHPGVEEYLVRWVAHRGNSALRS